VQSLSGVIDRAVGRAGDGGDPERLRRHALRLEREIRRLVAAGAVASLRDAAAAAARQLTAADPLMEDSLNRLREALETDGQLVGCDADAPARLLRHLWQAAHADKARRFRARLDPLVMRLSDILSVDRARSQEGRSPERLRAGIGATQQDAFDFAALSRLVDQASPPPSLPPARRERIRWLLSVLTAQLFYPADGDGYRFVYDQAAEAIAAYRERLPKAVELALALAVAELDVAGAYDEGRHGRLFAEFGPDNIDPADLDLLPDYLVCVRAAAMRPADYDAMLDAWAAGMRVKLLVQTDEVVPPSGGGVFSWRPNQLARTVMDLDAYFVLQTSSANLFRLRDAARRGIVHAGSALFSVYAGDAGKAGLAPYLAAAAATESRAWPTFVYDPAAGPDWASRLRLEDNPQAERSWPVQAMAYEDDGHRRLSDTVAFTLADFVACDPRYRRHFARVARADWTDGMLPVGAFLDPQASAPADKVPYIWMVDGEDRLHRVLVDEKLIREARRCGDMWRSLQELGGIRNSHAERLLKHERELWERQARLAPQPAAPTPDAAAPPPAPAAAPAPPPVPAEAAEPARSDDPYIETPRCTTCNECTQINPKMFAYNENKQAYVADPDAGTYRQLVEAAESCQVAIIHPGKPRNPNEPGLDELMKRAEAFL
jgi:hypothetical protein